jgi:hypothetical protein
MKTGDTCPKAGNWRGSCVDDAFHVEKRTFKEDAVFPACARCGHDAFWTLAAKSKKPPVRRSPPGGGRSASKGKGGRSTFS